MIRFTSLLVASDLIGTSLDIENALALDVRIVAILIGATIFAAFLPFGRTT